MSKDSSAQTEFDLQREEVRPQYVEPPKGVEKSTMIEEGELFDFEQEVQLVVDVLVGKILDQAQSEVEQESELQQMRQRKQRFERQRDQLIVETQRLELKAQREETERQRRNKQLLEAKMRQKELEEKVLAVETSQHLVRRIVDSTMQNVACTAIDPIQTQVEQQYFPSLMQVVASKLEEYRRAQNVLDELLYTAVRNESERLHKERLEQEEKTNHEVLERHQQREREKQMIEDFKKNAKEERIKQLLQQDQDLELKRLKEETDRQLQADQARLRAERGESDQESENEASGSEQSECDEV